MRRRSVIGGLFGLGTGAAKWFDTPLNWGEVSAHVPEDAEPVSRGTTVERTLTDGEEDWFTIDLQAEETVCFALLGFDYWFKRGVEIILYTPDGTVLDSTKVTQTELPRVAIGTTVPETGTYAVRIASLGGQIPYSLLFDVADKDPDPNEINDDRESATEIGIDDPVDGVIIDNEEDWFRFEVNAGEGIEFELTAENLAINRDLEISLFDPSGDEIGEVPRDRPFSAYKTVSNFNFSSLNTAFGADVAEEDGSYFIQVQGLDGAVDGFTTYKLVVKTVDLGQDEPNESRETATPITPGEPVEATLAGYDRDWYQFTAEAGDEIVIDYEVIQFVDLFDREVTLYDPLGNVLSTSTRVLDEPVTAETAGTHSIRIAQGDDNGVKPFLEKEGYRLTVLRNQNMSSKPEQVTFSDQDSDGMEIVVDEVSLPESGFVVLHDERLFTDDDGVFPSIRGVSSFLTAGSHELVHITLDEPLTDSQRLWAVAYRDTNQNGEFDYVATNAREDTPRYTGSTLVMDDACITKRRVC
ncbi:hypothetical protein SAMN04487950_4573 [Halogranum rubrum]|uniref:DUF7282 domain-containing protein n=1 Tax=Halogranum rubrum TaxID=553466 RepID=A0A1I4JMT7_9EURY|nr:hypothetical protein [Halogranum rubrum]SFL67523.1 hypothetical protein SAMN04487950_4573 [Halogranum rubrum]